jgi:hypothetical protein
MSPALAGAPDDEGPDDEGPADEGGAVAALRSTSVSSMAVTVSA